MAIVIFIFDLLFVLLANAGEVELYLRSALIGCDGGFKGLWFWFRFTRDWFVMGGVGEPLEGLVDGLLDHLESILALSWMAWEGVEDVAGTSNYIAQCLPLAQE